MNIYFIITFFAIMMLVAIGWFWKIRRRQVSAVASIVTVIGVLGTFLGIAIGLYQFDTGNIEASVPKLLNALKFAFVTSILGIAGSILLKWSALNERKRQAALEETYTGATVDDLAGLLRNILSVEQEEGKETRETLRAIEKSLTGEGDSTVLTQLQKLRTTLSDKQDDLIRSFNEFTTQTAENNTQVLIKVEETRETLLSIEDALTGEGDSTVPTQLQKLRTTLSDKQDDLTRSFKEFATQMAENNTVALIRALEEVMRDFNAKINEQFGDNFKQLNEAVGRINEWQEQYRQQMNVLAAEFQVAAESIEKSRQSLEIIAERSGAIVSNSETLDPILQALQHQIQQLDDHLTAFSALADNARNAFPIIENRLNQLTDDFSTVVRETIDDSHASMQNQRENLTNQSQQLETMVENTGLHIQQQTEDIFQNTTTQIEQVIDRTFQGLKNSVEDQSEKLQSIVTETNQGLENTLQTQSEQLQTMVENTSRHIQQQTDGIFQYATTRIEPLIDSTFQGLKNSVEDQSKKLQSIVTETNQGLENTLRTQSEQLQTMVENTSEQLQKLTNDFSTMVQETIDNSHTSMQSQQETLNDFSKVVRESIDNSHASMERQRETLQDFTGRIEEVIRSTHQGLENTLKETNQGLENTLQTQSRQLSTETERVFRESGERMTGQIQLLDTALQEELTKALNSLGNQLTSLSGRFVEDYMPLTQRLHDVVRIAESLPQTSSYQERQ